MLKKDLRSWENELNINFFDAKNQSKDESELDPDMYLIQIDKIGILYY